MIGRGGLLLGLLMAPVSAASAQVTSQNPLTFGTVITGQTTNILYTSSFAARWRIHFTLVATGITLTFTLPSTLVRTPGGETMGITWPAGQGAYRINNNGVAGATTFTPATGVNFGATTFLLNNDIYVWLGGRVSPPLNQRAGSYSGTVTLTLTGVAL